MSDRLREALEVAGIAVVLGLLMAISVWLLVSVLESFPCL